MLISVDVINPGNGWPEFVLRFHEGLQGIEDGNDLGYFEKFLLVKEIAMITPKPTTPQAHIFRKYKKPKPTSLLVKKKSNF